MSKIGCPITLGEYNKIMEQEKKFLDLQSIIGLDFEEFIKSMKTHPNSLDSYIITSVLNDGRILEFCTSRGVIIDAEVK